MFCPVIMVYFFHELTIQRGEGTIKEVIKCFFQSLVILNKHLFSDNAFHILSLNFPPVQCFTSLGVWGDQKTIWGQFGAEGSCHLAGGGQKIQHGHMQK